MKGTTKGMHLKRGISTGLALAFLVMAWGSLITIHATTPHFCSNPKFHDSNGKQMQHACHHDGQHTLALDDSGPTLPPDPIDPGYRDGCMCPFDSFDCFINLVKFQGDPEMDLRRQIFTKRSGASILHHGLFYRGSLNGGK